MKITDKQLEFIQADVFNRGIHMHSLAEDIIDHICCAIEASEEGEFDQIYKAVIDAFGEEGLYKIEEATIQLLTIKKEKIMKKTMYLIGFIATFLSSTGILFKILHWPGANIMLLVGIVLINIGFLPLYFYDKYKRSVALD